MAGLLEAVLNGNFAPTDELDGQGALLTELLKRLEAGKVPVQGRVTTKGDELALTGDMQRMAQLATPVSPQKTAHPETPQVTVTPNAPFANDSLPPREVKDGLIPGEPYKAPDATIVPDDIRRRETAVVVPTKKTAPSDGTEMTFAERLTALGRGYNKGGLLGGIGDMLGGDTDNVTVKALMNRLNVDKATAMAMVKSPQLAPLLFGNKGAPQIVKVPGPYGQEIDMVWNPDTRKLDPLSSLMSPAVTTPSPTPSAPTPPTVLNAQPVTPSQSTPTQVAPAPPSLKMSAPVAPATPTTPPTAPLSTPATPTSPDNGEFTVGQAVPKPPEGYLHKLSPDGKGYLWTKTGQPVFVSKTDAEARSKTTEEDRNKALAAVETVRKISDILEKLDRPFEKPYRNKMGEEYNVWGDVVGPWAVPSNANAGGNWAGQLISGLTNVPAYYLQASRNLSSTPEVVATRRALNELETSLTALQSSRVKELFGSANLSDADREAAAKTVGTLNARDAQALKGQLSVGEKDSLVRVEKALREGLIKADDIPPDVMKRGIAVGIFKPEIVFQRGR